MNAKKQQKKLFFTGYNVSCYLSTGPETELLSIELSPFAVLVAASSVQTRTGYSIESCMADAMIHILRSITDQFTITNINTQ